MIYLIYVPIVVRVKRVALVLRRAQHASWLSIAIENVKLLTGLNTRRLVRRGLRNYTMRNSLSSLYHFIKTVQSASFGCQHLIQGADIMVVAEKMCAVYDDKGNVVVEKTCPFCRTLLPMSDEEENERIKKRVEAGDATAIFNVGNYYADGLYGFAQDYAKALKLWHRAGELGCTDAYCRIGSAYKFGRGVEVDNKKTNHYYELAAMRGSTGARYNLATNEANAGNIDRALKHYTIAVKDGDSASLENIKRMHMNGHATKDNYTAALRLHQEYLNEIKSDQRDKAAAEDEDYKYY